VNAATNDPPHIDRAGQYFPAGLLAGPIMFNRHRRIAFSSALVALAAVFSLLAAATSSSALAAGGVPPFCIARGGGAEGGGGGPQDCRYFDYQSCLQASATLHGNCVQNIDYHGEVSTAPAPARTRHRR
jgi:hypothetical protein